MHGFSGILAIDGFYRRRAEEIGWRGYILAHLEKRFGVIIGSLLLSVAWAIWHLPLWLVPGAVQSCMSFGGFMLLTCGYSFIYSWGLKKAENKPLAGLVMHGTANSFIPLFPILAMRPGDSQPRFWIWVSLTFLIGVAFLLFLKKEKMQASQTA